MNYELFFDYYLPNLNEDKKKFIKETDLAHKLIVFQSAHLGFTINVSMYNTALILRDKKELKYFIEQMQNLTRYKNNDVKKEALSIVESMELFKFTFYTSRKTISDLQTGDIFKFNDVLMMKTSVIDKYRNETLCVEPNGQAKFYPNDTIIE